MKRHRIYTMRFARVYPEYVAKAEKKGRTKAEVDEVSYLPRKNTRAILLGNA